jgi:hypothetical protein
MKYFFTIAFLLLFAYSFGQKTRVSDGKYALRENIVDIYKSSGVIQAEKSFKNR